MAPWSACARPGAACATSFAPASSRPAASSWRKTERQPTLTFRWLDIEDEADALGDLDVETFPTLVIGGRDGAVRFAGPVLPQPGQIARLLQSLGL